MTDEQSSNEQSSNEQSSNEQSSIMEKAKTFLGIQKRDKPDSMDDWNSEELVNHYATKSLSRSEAMRTTRKLIPLDRLFLHDKRDKIDLSEQTYLDLEMFEDNMHNRDETIFNKISECRTVYGEHYMEHCLNNPIINTDKLERRQKLMQYYESKKDCHEKVKQNLKTIDENQDDILWFWDNEEEQHMQSLNSMLFFNLPHISHVNVNDILNNNEWVMLAYTVYKLFFSTPLVVLAPIIPVIIIFCLAKFVLFRNDSILKKIRIKGIDVEKMMGEFTLKRFMEMTLKQMFSQGEMLQAQCNAMFGVDSIVGKLVKLASQCFWFFMYFYNISTSLHIRSIINRLLNLIKKKTQSISTVLINIKEIYEPIRDCPKDLMFEEFGLRNQDFCDFYTNIDNIFGTRYIEKTDSIFGIGKVLTTYNKFLEVKNMFPQLLQFVGVVDYHQGLTSLLETKKFCYPKYIKNAIEPKLATENMIHPYLHESGFGNTINIDSNKTRSILITGPNAAGKSTFIKAVITNIILAQTLGISASESFEFTPFHLVNTYLHIPDCKGRESLFEAEMHRSKDYLDKLENLENGQFSFLVMDELFSSTNYIEGYSAAYSMLKKMADYGNNLSMITTHFTDLSDLEKDTNKLVKNYKFYINRDEQNNIVYPYKLMRGISRQYIAIELLGKSGMNPDIVNEALRMCQKLQHKKNIDQKRKTLKNKKMAKEKLQSRISPISQSRKIVNTENPLP